MPKRRKGKTSPPCSIVSEIVGDGVEMFIVFDGKKIAKRGHPGTPQTPGYTVLDGPDLNSIQVTYTPPALQ
jgi:hypothetical protein